MRTYIAAAIFAALAAFTFTSAKAGDFLEGEQADVSLCRGWIDLTCSCSHRSCWEPKPGEFKSLGDGRWLETATGQIKEQTSWSKDGSFVVCAWRKGEKPGVSYHVGRGNPLRCVHPPVPSSSISNNRRKA